MERFYTHNIGRDDFSKYTELIFSLNDSISKVRYGNIMEEAVHSKTRIDDVFTGERRCTVREPSLYYMHNLIIIELWGSIYIM